MKTRHGFLSNELGIKAFKISSGDITNLPLLEHTSHANKTPMIVSTANVNARQKSATAVNVITGAGNRNITLLHCVSQYPASPADAKPERNANEWQAGLVFQWVIRDHTPRIEIALAPARNAGKRS